MARPKTPIPQPRLHPASGRARVTIGGRDFYLGKFGSPEADEAYRRMVAQWLAKEGLFTIDDDDPITIEELTAAYWLHAETYYGFKSKNKWTGSAINIKQVVAILNRLYASLPAAEFGPLDFKAVVGEFVREGWARSHVNHQASRVKAIFKWGVSEEMIPPATWHVLLAVPGLKRGKCDAPETDPVEPVSIEHVIAAKKHLRSALAAMVEFYLLTGCRPNEACVLRGGEIDRSNTSCWVFRPKHHKTAHHGHKRLPLIGPKAQTVICPYLDGCGADEYVFSPKREEIKRLQERHAKRKSPMTPSQLARIERARLRIRRRQHRDRYSTASLRRAIGRACETAKISTWGPNRLRHTRATELHEHGLDTLATILGHSKIETTLIYAERNLRAAMELVGRVG